MKNILAILLLAMCGTLCAAQPVKGDHNNDGHPDNGNVKTESVKILTDKYDADVAKLTKELVAALTEIQNDEARNGNLEGALEARDCAKRYSDRLVAKPSSGRVDAPAVKPNVAVLEKPKAFAGLTKETALGVYKIQTSGGWNGAFSILPKGRAAQHGATGTWALKGNVISITWDTVGTEWFEMTSATEGHGADKDGIPLVATKISDVVTQPK